MNGEPALSRKIEVIDSHTAGEPTRCILSGGPDLGKRIVAGTHGTIAEPA